MTSLQRKKNKIKNNWRKLTYYRTFFLPRFIECMSIRSCNIIYQSVHSQKAEYEVFKLKKTYRLGKLLVRFFYLFGKKNFK